LRSLPRNPFRGEQGGTDKSRPLLGKRLIVTARQDGTSYIPTGRYHGDAILKQLDFGITPVSMAGGTVKVKNELKIEFDIATEAESR